MEKASATKRLMLIHVTTISHLHRGSLMLSMLLARFTMVLSLFSSLSPSICCLEMDDRLSRIDERCDKLFGFGLLLPPILEEEEESQKPAGVRSIKIFALGTPKRNKYKRETKNRPAKRV